MFNLLCNKYGEHNIHNVEDYYGFDFALLKPRLNIEVKTTYIDSPIFYISKNELKTYSLNPDKYRIMLVILNKSKELLDIKDIDSKIINKCSELLLDIEQVNIYYI